MKKAFLVILAAAAFYGCEQSKPATEQTEATATETKGANTYGAGFAEENVIPASELQQKVAGQDSVEAVVTAEIVESCQSKGCWMDVKLTDGSNMKVTFRDYGFFLPVEDLKGKTVVFKGTAKREVISVADQQHYAQDAGKSEAEIAAITSPREELRFVADGVVLK